MIQDNKLIDTSVLIPHLECYFIKDTCLFVEHTDGSYTNLGKIIKQFDDFPDNNSSKS